jgi:hypothetical protein
MVSEVASSLTPADFLAAQVRAIHALHGAYYDDVSLLPPRNPHLRVLMPTPINTPFDTAPAPTITMVNGATQFTYTFEFGGYCASPEGWRAFYRDIAGQDTIVGRLLDVPAWQAYLQANGAPAEPMLNSAPPVAKLTPDDAAVVGAPVVVVAKPAEAPTHKVVPLSTWAKIEQFLANAGHSVESIL